MFDEREGRVDREECLPLFAPRPQRQPFAMCASKKKCYIEFDKILSVVLEDNESII